MSASQRIICQYCGTSNPWEAQTCLACGAPIVRPKIDLKPAATILAASPDKPQEISEAELLDIGEKADDIYFKFLNTYAIAWRTVGEVISIALTGFLLGFVGGASRMVFPGVLGALLVGTAVGFSRKPFYLVLISAPVGLLLGLGLGALSWILGGRPQIMVFTGMVFALIGAVIGGRRNPPLSRRNCWEQARPLLGAMGGFAFGLFGALVGWGIAAGVQAILSL